MTTIKSEMSTAQVAESCGLATDSGIESSTTSSSSNSVASNSIISTASSSSASSTTSPHAANNSDCVTNNTTNTNNNNNNNTVSAAADSSDNQPGTPQPTTILNIVKVEPQQSAQILHQPYVNTNENGQQLYATATTTATATSSLPYDNIYAATAQDLTSTPTQQTHYNNYMSNYDTFYHHHHHQQQQQSTANFHANSILYNSNNNNSTDYKATNSVRYHPYMPAETSGDLSNDTKNLPSTTSVMSPSMVSSSSPTSTSAHLPYGGTIGAPNSPNDLVKRQCKKCGHMSNSEHELQEHVSNVHGASPYGSSSGYSSSPFIKEERTTPNNGQHATVTTAVAATANAGDILDLDSQKMVYPHNLEHIQRAALLEDPLHSMHSMQQRALPTWEQTTDGANAYYAATNKPNNLPFNSCNIKQEYGLTSIKSEFPDSQHFVDNNGGGVGVVTSDLLTAQSQSIAAQTTQQNVVNNLPIASSPAEFPTTTTVDGVGESQQQQQQQQQQQYRNFEPPTSSSTLPTNSITTKAATWKSNEARRPKTYNCTACNKWFTSSGHLKRHYNTTLHKNAVKSSNQPDPATQPISTHHHPWRDPNGKNNRRNSQQQQQQQQQQNITQQTIEPPTANSPDFTSLASKAGHLSQYSASPSPTSINGGFQQQCMTPTANNLSPRLNAVGTASPSTHVLNGHPNALAGPSAPTTTATTSSITTMSSQTRGLLNNTTMLHTQKNEIMVEDTTKQTTVGTTAAAAATTTTTTATIVPTVHVVSMQQQQHLQQQELLQSMEEQRQQQQQQQQQQSHHQLELQHQQQELLLAHSISSSSSNNNNNSITITNSNNNSNSSTNRTTSPHIICHQQYLAEQEQTQIVDNIYTRTTPTPPIQPVQVHLQTLPPAHSIMEQQLQPLQQQQRAYSNIMHLDINTNTNMQPQYMHTHMATTVGRPMGHMAMDSSQVALAHQQLQQDLQMQQQQQQQQQQQSSGEHLVAVKLEMDVVEEEEEGEMVSEEELQPQQQQRLPSMQHTLLNNTSLEGLDTMLTTTTNTMLSQQQQQHIIPTHITTPITTAQQLQPQHMQLLPPHTTNTIPCFQQLQQQALESASAALLPLEPTMTYHTIIGNPNAIKCNTNNNFHINNTTTDYLQLASSNPFDGYATTGTTTLQQQLITTSDGQILQLIPTNAAQFPLFTFTNNQNVNCSNNNNNNNNNNNHHENAPYGILTESFAPISARLARRSPQEADLPPSSTNNQESAVQRTYSPTISSSSSSNCQSILLSNNKDNTNNQYQININSNNNNTNNINKRKCDELENAVSSTPKVFTVKRRRTNNNNANNSNNNNNNNSNIGLQQLSNMPNGRIKCLECDKEFTKICYLTQHNKSFHSGEYPYRCQKCGKRFQDETVYTAHLARHKSQDKPHKCELCPKQFHHKTDLRRHIEAIHTGLKQHVCEVCEKSFCRKDHLRKHLETHTRTRVIGGNKKNFLLTTPTTNTHKTTITSDDLNKSNINTQLVNSKDVDVVVNGMQFSTITNQQQQQHKQILENDIEEHELRIKLEGHSLLLNNDEEEFIEIDQQQHETQHNADIQQNQQLQQQESQQQFRLTEIVLY